MADLSSMQIYYETREFCHQDAYKHLSNMRRAFVELKLKTKKALHENQLFWEQEVEKAKQEKDQEWLEKYHSMEEENKKLRLELENVSTSDTEDTCYNDFPLWEAQQKIDLLNRKLDQKQIMISKLQIALAEQSKIMFELEKSNFLLHFHYQSALRKKERQLREHLKTCNNKLDHPI